MAEAQKRTHVSGLTDDQRRSLLKVLTAVERAQITYTSTDMTFHMRKRTAVGLVRTAISRATNGTRGQVENVLRRVQDAREQEIRFSDQ